MAKHSCFFDWLQTNFTANVFGGNTCECLCREWKKLKTAARQQNEKKWLQDECIKSHIWDLWKLLKCVAALFQADTHFREIHFFMWFFEFQKIDLPSTKKIQKNDWSHEKSSFFEFPLHVLERTIFWKSKNHKWRITFGGNSVLHLCFLI